MSAFEKKAGISYLFLQENRILFHVNTLIRIETYKYRYFFSRNRQATIAIKESKKSNEWQCLEL